MSIIGNNFFNYNFEPQILKKKDDTEEESVKVPEIEAEDGLPKQTVTESESDIVPVTDIPVDTLIACAKLNIEKQESEKPTLDEVIKQMGLRSTNCKGVYCQKHNPDMPEGNNTHLKHYVWNSATHEMIELVGVYFIDSTGRQARGQEGYGLILAQMQGFTPQEDGTFVKANIVYTFDSAKNIFVKYEPKPEDTSVISTDSVDTTAPATEENLQAELAKAKENLAKAQKALQENTDETKTEELHKALDKAMKEYSELLEEMAENGKLKVVVDGGGMRSAGRVVSGYTKTEIIEYYDEDDKLLYTSATKYDSNGNEITKTEDFYSIDGTRHHYVSEYENGEIKTSTYEYFDSDGTRYHYVSEYENGEIKTSTHEYFYSDGTRYHYVGEYENGEIITETTEYFDSDGTISRIEVVEHGSYGIETRTNDFYDTDGTRRHFVEEYYSNGRLKETNDFYDTDGTRTREVYEYDSNKILSVRTTEQYNSDGILIKKTWEDLYSYSNGKRYQSKEYEYDSNGKLKMVTHKFYNTDGSVKQHTVSVYDPNGNVITETIECLNSDGTKVRTKVIEYDSNGKAKSIKEYDIQGYDKFGFNADGVHRSGKTAEDMAKEFVTAFSSGEYTIEAAQEYLDSLGAVYEVKTEGNKTIITFNLFNQDYKAEVVYYDENGFDCEGYDIQGYDKFGFNADGVHRSGKTAEDMAKEFVTAFSSGEYTIEAAQEYLDSLGAVYEVKTEGNKTIIAFNLFNQDYKAEVVYYDENGFDCEGFDRQGYDKDGFNAQGVNKQGKTRNQIKADTFVKDFASGKYSYEDAVNYLKSIGAKIISSKIKLFGLSRVLTFSIDGATYTTQCSLIELILASLQNIFG